MRQQTTTSFAIYPIKALSDNYIWAIVQQNRTVLVDVGECAPALTFLRDRQLDLAAILTTHRHSDHTDGVAELLTHYPRAKLYANKNHGLNTLAPILVDDGDEIWLFADATHSTQDAPIKAVIKATNGHTDCDLTYQIGQHVFCGDTLFRAGCGRVLSGTMDELFASFLWFDGLADDAIFYPAHEYTLNNLAFARACEPNNGAVLDALLRDKNTREQNLPTLPTKLTDERKINPFLRALNPNEALKQYTQKETPRAVFAALRAKKDAF